MHTVEECVHSRRHRELLHSVTFILSTVNCQKASLHTHTHTHTHTQHHIPSAFFPSSKHTFFPALHLQCIGARYMYACSGCSLKTEERDVPQSSASLVAPIHCPFSPVWKYAAQGRPDQKEQTQRAGVSQYIPVLGEEAFHV